MNKKIKYIASISEEIIEYYNMDHYMVDENNTVKKCKFSDILDSMTVATNKHKSQILSHLNKSQKKIYKGNDDDVKFSVDTSYAKTYLTDSYEPEKYNELRIIHDELSENFNRFIEEHEEYSHFRTISIGSMRANDVVDVYNVGEVTINEINSDQVIVTDKRNHQHCVSRSDLRPKDSIISKLKARDINILYTYLKNHASKIIDNILFFYVFSEYFKLNEKNLFNALSDKEKQQLLKSLNKKLNIFGETKPEW